MGLNVHSNLLRLIRAGGMWGDGYLCPKTYSLYSLHCHHQIDCIKAGSCVRRYNVTLIMGAKSQDTVHKPHFFKRKESWSRSNQGPSAYQHSTLPLGHTSSRGLYWGRSECSFACFNYWQEFCPVSAISVHSVSHILLEEPNWQQLSYLFVFVLIVALKKRIPSNICILSCFVWLKSVLLNLLCDFALFFFSPFFCVFL